jgi:hypothetical protein
MIKISSMGRCTSGTRRGPSAPFSCGRLSPEYRQEGGGCGASYLICPITDGTVRCRMVRGTRICDRQV